MNTCTDNRPFRTNPDGDHYPVFRKQLRQLVSFRDGVLESKMQEQKNNLIQTIDRNAPVEEDEQAVKSVVHKDDFKKEDFVI